MPAPFIREVEAWFETEKTKLESALEAEWQVLKPDIVNLGKTILSQVMQAAETYVAGGMNPGSGTAAIAAITAQLPADIAAAEHIVAGAFSTAVAKLTAAPPATP